VKLVLLSRNNWTHPNGPAISEGTKRLERGRFIWPGQRRAGDQLDELLSFIARPALLIGAIALPGSFLAKLMVERMPLHVHSALLDAVVITGGATMAVAAFAG
jgi:hypothetical protein